jgi:CBS domain-containing protein
MKLAQVIAMRAPGKPPVTVAPTDSVRDAVHRFCESRAGCLLVVDPESRNLVGIVTHSDIIGLCEAGHADADALARARVAEVMTRDVILGHPDDDVRHVLAIMGDKNIGRLPVVDGGRVVALLTIGDLLGVLFDEDELKIRYLSDYLEGTYACKVY